MKYLKIKSKSTKSIIPTLIPKPIAREIKPIEVSSPVPMLNFIMDCCIGKPTIPEVKQELLQEVKERVRPLPEPAAKASGKANACALPEPVYVKPLIKKPDYYAVIHPRPVREMIQEPKEIKVEPKNPVGSREWKKQQFLINNI
jgi:hypothetical protein